MDPVVFQNDEDGRKAFSSLALKATEWMANYYPNVESYPTRSQVSPGEIYNAFPDHPPATPVNDDDVFKILNEVIIPGITHWQHPNFYAFFPGNTSFHSFLSRNYIRRYSK